MIQFILYEPPGLLPRLICFTLTFYKTLVLIEGRPLCNLQFGDDIDLIVGTEAELQDVNTRLETVWSMYGMGISIEKRKILLNSLKEYDLTNIINEQTIQEGNTFMYLGSIICTDCSFEKRVQNYTSDGLNSNDKTGSYMEKQHQLYS